LYYRLDGLRIRMPGLAERPEDVPMLVEHFLRMETSRLSRTWTLTPEVMAALVRRAWPGNVRELRNEVARCADRDQLLVRARQWLYKGSPRFQCNK
jgi:DNA-binding NtrC family response regulator